jgi:hypothetical protein
MQGSNKRGNALKKPKLIAGESANDEPTTNESANDVPTTDEPTTDEPTTDKPPTNEPASEPDTMEPQDTSRDVPYREDTSDDMARFALVSPIAVDETTVGGVVETDLPAITYADGMAILDEYFPISAVDSRPLNCAVAPDELSMSTTDTACRNFPLVPSILSFTPEESNTSLDIISSESFTLPSPHQSTSGFEMSTPNTSLPQLLSSCGDSSSCSSSETDGTDFGSLGIATNTPLARRLVLDDTAQLLEHVLAALESAYDDSRIPGLSVPGILESILTKGDHTNFVKIMTSVTEN